MSEILTSSATKVIAFQLKDKEYAFPVQQVQSIEKLMHITRVPGTSPFIKGVINLRGVVTPIVDLRSRFQLPEEYNEQARIIITVSGDTEIGLIVDGANDVLDIPGSVIELQPEGVGGAEEDYIVGVAKLEKRLIILLDLEKVL
ncbi:chemotaxis protein CheW [Bacillus thermotolerans]|uniref:Positive regulator of CheA protein activity (CheW) n=1 Tax=Bacillus thermotolerans TaxID=1221996 RepID=A0A0F5I0X5_BACTR|nr:chemotaxis protein CheW [Bacillus thermotolerans]KKB38955.1 Positive regulator of CheA protein activity (CheW) [Bacillus thermotolerans]KKB42379.1 Positive regulator of CheA protein activity (CheW) [Bacillus thermotolerans]